VQCRNGPRAGLSGQRVRPVLFGFRENGGTLPRGLWIIDGVYRVVFAPTGYKTVTMLHGTTTNICPRIE